MKKLLLAIALTSVISVPALSQADVVPRYLGEIFTLAFTANGSYCPENSHEANGQLMDIKYNVALFSIIGTTYGGDGKTTFALPNLNDTGDKSGKPVLKNCIATNGWFPPEPPANS